jgi:Spy/CpxP family protein refolding chaperone
MSRSKAIAVAFYLGAVLIGGAAGVAIDRKFVRARLENLTRDPRAMRERFFSDLRFTDAQRTAWDSIETSARRADSVLRAPIQAERDSIRKASFAAQRAVLTPEQQQVLDERQARRSRPGPGSPNDGKSR